MPNSYKIIRDRKARIIIMMAYKPLLVFEKGHIGNFNLDTKRHICHHYVMKSNKKNMALVRRQLDEKLSDWRKIKSKTPPSSGWLRAIRESIGLTRRQVALRMKIDPKTLLKFEEGELTGTITLNSLRRVADNLNCTLLYAMLPSETLDRMLEKQATKVAANILRHTSQSMKLEKQAISTKEEQQQIKELAQELKSSLKRVLWEEG